jgi:PUA domain protein
LIHTNLTPRSSAVTPSIRAELIIKGANMMAPGFLSAGGNLPDGLEEGRLVAIHAEGKEHACGIGKMSASSEEVKKAGKGVAVEVVTWIG